MNIGEAIDLMRDNRYVARSDWGHRVYVFLPPGTDIITYSHNGYDSPWVPSHQDLLGLDWQEIIPHP